MFSMMEFGSKTSNFTHISVSFHIKYSYASTESKLILNFKVLNLLSKKYIR